MRWRFQSPRERLANELSSRADSARDDRRYRDAAVLYAEVLRLCPSRAQIAIQAGHMFKESRDFAAAERHYFNAQSRLPHDAELALQLGHFYKTIDRLHEALEQYRRAAELAPEWLEARQEADGLVAFMRGGFAIEPPVEHGEGILPELLPKSETLPRVDELDDVVLRRLGGRRVRIGGRDLPMLNGVEAIRGLCFSEAPLRVVELILNGALLHSEPTASAETSELGVVKTVFNIWIDLSVCDPGEHVLEIVLSDVHGRTRRRIERVIIRPPRSEVDHPDSDGVVTIDPEAREDVVTQIRAKPSIRRSARRNALGKVRSILVMRTDQLGDMVISIPALRRLRSLFPDATLVGLVTTSNSDLAHSLELFDDVIVANFPDDMARRQRVMTREDQEELGSRLAAFHFDVAIDLASSDMSRPLLQLTKARILYGFDDNAWPWMDAGLAGGTHDAANGNEMAAQSGRVRALVERLGTLADSGAVVVRRGGLEPTLLPRFGIAAGQSYVVLHTGGRITFSRWQGYADLARALLTRGVEKIVAIVEDEESRAALAAVEGVLVIDQRLPFDHLDTLLSYCAVFVGNDSGPKHLASLRGAPVVSIHAARINWNEWGQEQTGTIISRRVPCAGCAIYHDPDECAKGFACVADIRVEEVLDSVLTLLPAS